MSKPRLLVPSQANASGGPPFTESAMGSATQPQASPVSIRGSESGEHGVNHVNATGGATVGVGVALGVGVGVVVGVGVAVTVAVGRGLGVGVGGGAGSVGESWHAKTATHASASAAAPNRPHGPREPANGATIPKWRARLRPFDLSPAPSQGATCA